MTQWCQADPSREMSTNSDPLLGNNSGFDQTFMSYTSVCLHYRNLVLTDVLKVYPHMFFMSAQLWIKKDSLTKSEAYPEGG